jgi:hypothetical protein
MAPVNQYLIPPGWFAISIFFTELFAIAFPIAQVVKTNHLQQETLDAIASWEKRHQLRIKTAEILDSESQSAKSTTFSGSTALSAPNSPLPKTSIDSQKSDMLTMAALENALRSNAEPLLQFAALKDFSGENVSFLTHVAEWKRDWQKNESPAPLHRHKQFVAAVRIYASFVSLQYSEFPINISSRHMKTLHNMFEAAATTLFRSGSVTSLSDSATPFDNPIADDSSTVDLRSGRNLSDTLGKSNLKSVMQMTELGRDAHLEGYEIPQAFGADSFDAAESEIKYLVLTNTWPKFVNSGYESSQLSVERQAEEGRSWWGRKLLCDR